MMKVLAVFYVLGALLAQTASAQLTFTDESIPENCEVIAEPGDHLLLSYEVMLSNGNMGNTVRRPEQLFSIMLESSESPVHSAIKGMCQNSTRKITWATVDNVNMAPIPQSKSFWEDYEMGGVSLTVNIEHITKPEDFKIFTALQDENISQVMDLVEQRKGINAVDQWGQSPVSSMNYPK
jgi:hypothetical protein